MNKFWLLALPLLLPTARMGYGSYYAVAAEIAIVIFLRFAYTKGVSRSHELYHVPKNIRYDTNSHLLIFYSSIVIIYIITIGLFSSSDDSRLYSTIFYIVRISLWVTLFVGIRPIYRIAVKLYGPAAAFSALLGPIVIFTAMGGVFEFFSHYTQNTSLLSLFKARQNIGGFDTIQYLRYSGFYAFPGDLGIACVMGIALISTVTRKKWIVYTIFLILVLLLYKTQSRAAIATFIAYLFLVSFLRLARYKLTGAILYLLVAMILCIIIYLKLDYVVDYIEGDYLLRNTDSTAKFIERSKRIQEYIEFGSAPMWQKIFGLRYPYLAEFYESEWMGLISRLGIISFPIVLFFTWRSIKLALIFTLSRSRPDINMGLSFATYWISFLLVYCSFSAGFSRPKLLIISAILAVPLIDASTEKLRVSIGMRWGYSKKR
ncbi:hypothetical protein [Oricola indica]|uniref:hypothetical protein n=1 Tax=Oricola indica TaxID=2872591 RepID=UPI003CCC1FEB